MTTDVPVVSRPHSHGGEAAATAIKPAETKAQALRSYAVADFPAVTGREEEWRFTPLKRLRGLADGSFAAGGVAPTAQFDALPTGVTIRRVADEPRKGSVLTPFDRVSALAYERSAETLVVDVAAEAVVAEPVTVRLVGSGADGASFGHTFIEVGALAEVTLILDQTGSTTYADNVEVVVGDGARLTLVSVADWADDAVQAQHQKLRLGRDARAVHVAVNLGGDLVRQYISVEYAGPGGDLEAYGVYFADGGQHLEHRQFVEHQATDCRSRVTYRGALQGAAAHTVWVGDVLIGANATGTDTYEVNRNLVLTDGARADSVPNLEIETGEIVGAGHASATGRFEDEHLFYLMSRGIDELSARRLVVRGFFVELLEKIPAGELRERLAAAIDERLAEAGA
ncbi:Fe-S cluster assembly protein SufD [Actinocatenispora thailandica]|uniref:Fe-S cluster assembly protein SufD n=1 Tax=Actinocatenispora thailandica TaxID=227318 RepID=A0A7R7HWS7_9ACTN|nr:Fe-S cluster assembly protein SufD [Actinocatenispora thailandica]BCJ35091.1 Fe-S cluster assembly protein SufD [Actinocatenispora thailandica]